MSLSHVFWNASPCAHAPLTQPCPTAVDGQHEELRADYSLPTADVYINFAVHLINRDSHLDILNYCHLDQNISGLPSWVPDWTVRHIPWPLFNCQRHPDGSFTRLYNASLNTTALAQFLCEQRILRIRGIFFDDIVDVSLPKLDQNLDGASMEDLVANWFETALGSDDAYITGGNKMKALQHTIRADLRWIDNNDLMRGGSVNWPDSGATIFEVSPISKPVTSSRRLIKTSTAYLEIASYNAMPGDIVCVLFGCSTPMVLRPVHKYFLLVGECYVHGIMDGEALESVNLETVSRIFEIR